MHRFLRELACAGSLAVMVLLTACGDDATGPVVGPPASLAIIGAPDTLLLHDRTVLRAVVLDTRGDTIPDPELTWASSLPGHVAVYDGGLVVANNAGSADITVRHASLEASVRITARTIAFASVAAGQGATCGIDAVAQLWCWGDLTVVGMQLAEGAYERKSSRPVPVHAGLRFRQVALGYGMCGVLEPPAEVRCWEWGGSEDGRAVPGTAGATHVAFADGHGCAALTSGEVTCWGVNGHGQLGDGSRVSRPDARVVPGLSDVAQVEVSRRHSCARWQSGELRCWGSNGFGQLGADTMYEALVPQLVPGVAATRLTGEDGLFCAEGTNPNLECWGWWYFGHAGRGSYSPVIEPLPVALRGIEVASDHACGLDAEGDAWCWGADQDGQLGRGAYGQNHVEYPPAKVLTDLRFDALTVRWGTTCGHTVADEIWCWGGLGTSGGSQEHGWASASPVRVPSPVALRDWQPEDLRGCGIDTAGRPWCIGYGAGAIQAIALPPGVALESIEGGPGLFCGLTLVGEAWCWGSGPFGDGVTESSPDRAVPVGGGLRFLDLSASGRHACAVERGTGRVHCWGRNVEGQLGDGTQENRVLPTPTSLTGAARVITSWTNTCAWQESGAVYCWGAAGGGALGTDVRLDSPIPLAAVKAGPATTMSLGTFSTCVLDPAGRATCLGWYPGAPWTASHPASFAALASGDRHTCGVTPAGEAWCWGLEADGRLGNGGTEGNYLYTPVQVRGGHRFVRLDAAYEHTCGRDVEGRIWCWGENLYGELGDGSVSDRAEPVKVLGQK